MMRWASALPSSTPHWSNELMLQIVPWVKTMCSYSATSLPRTSGVSRGARMVLDGRLPSNTRCGTSAGAVPSALTFFGRLAECQRLGLRKYIRHEDIVMPPQRRQRMRERDEIAGMSRVP
jgi:hypothetical protein